MLDGANLITCLLCSSAGLLAAAIAQSRIRVLIYNLVIALFDRALLAFIVLENLLI